MEWLFVIKIKNKTFILNIPLMDENISPKFKIDQLQLDKFNQEEIDF